MTINKLTSILAKHYIKYEVIGSKVIAEDEYTINGVLHTDTIDMTDISPDQLYDWLGY
jgi:hypothetical protein